MDHWVSLRAAGQARLEAMTVPASTMFETFGGYPMEFFRQISLIAEECRAWNYFHTMAFQNTKRHDDYESTRIMNTEVVWSINYFLVAA